MMWSLLTSLLICAEDGSKLITLLARNNNVIADVISRLGILEGSDVAWEDHDAGSTWNALRKGILSFLAKNAHFCFAQTQKRGLLGKLYHDFRF